jgi:hypothetical protein
MKNKSQYIAQLENWNDTLQTISTEEFWLHCDKGNLVNINIPNYMASVWSYSIDGYDYHLYNTIKHVGWEGEYDSLDEYACCIQRATVEEREQMLSILSQY